MTLYDPADHEALRGPAWSQEAASETIEDVLAATATAYDSGSWPPHPDDFERDETPQSFPMLYMGGSGITWAVSFLQRAGYAPGLAFDAPEVAAHIARTSPASVPDEPWYAGSLFVGALGPKLACALLADDDAAAQRVADGLSQTFRSAADELFTGVPGGMLAARFMFERTGELRWKERFMEGFEQLWSRWEERAPGVFLWQNPIYDRPLPGISFVGPAHGFAGNIAIALAASGWIDAPRREELHRRAVSTVRGLALREEGAVNWPVVFGDPIPKRRLRADGRPKYALQWCHGAPGIAGSLAALPPGVDDEFERLLLDAGELTWQAGPLAKGAGLCHGTAGNGFTFLKLYRRTNDARWLERARAFAMHAIGQMHRQSERWQQPWHSLWTGDIGVALYLHACIAADGRICTFDAW